MTSSDNLKHCCLLLCSASQVLFLLLCASRVSHSLALPSARKMSHDLMNHQCGQVVDTITKEEAIAFIEEYISIILGYEIVEVFLNVIAPQMKHGVRSIKLCASCTMFQGGTYNNSFEDYCGSDVYGNDALVSGLLILPFDSTSDSGIGIPQGPLKGTFWMDFSETETFLVPSEFELGNSFYLPVMLPATLGAVTVLPDYLGYGESYQYYKSYLIRRAYQTSTIPLWLKAKQFVASETNCESELVDIVAVSGYSEGGYTAVAVGAALSSLGVEVLGVYAGGGPYRLSSALLVEGVGLFDLGMYPRSGWHYLALFLSSYSSTNPDVANFGQGQDFAADEYLSPTDSSKNVVRWVNDGLSGYEINYNLFPDDALSVVNEDFVAIIRRAVEENIVYPCESMDTIGVADKLCEALIDNDLTAILEAAQYKHELCHSTEDYIVPIQNLPNISANPFLSKAEYPGGHLGAAPLCVLNYVFFLISDDFLGVPAEFSGRCEAPTEEPSTAAPTGAPTDEPSTAAPTGAPTDEPTPTPTGAPTASPTRDSAAETKTIACPKNYDECYAFDSDCCLVGGGGGKPKYRLKRGENLGRGEWLCRPDPPHHAFGLEKDTGRVRLLQRRLEEAAADERDDEAGGLSCEVIWTAGEAAAGERGKAPAGDALRMERDRLVLYDGAGGDEVLWEAGCGGKSPRLKMARVRESKGDVAKVVMIITKKVRKMRGSRDSKKRGHVPWWVNKRGGEVDRCSA